MKGKLIYQLLYPRTVSFKCPECGASKIPYFGVKIGFEQRWVLQHFECPECGAQLQVSAAYAWSVTACSLVLGVAIAVAIGTPLLLLLPVGAALCVVVLMLAGAYVKILIPPTIHRYYPDDLSMRLGDRR